VDKDRTVSRRSEPSSRTTLTGEQPDPWDLLQPQEVMSRHRGAKPSRRYELLGPISLLSLAYLLSVARWRSHLRSTGSLGPAFAPARPVGLAVRRAYVHVLLDLIANQAEPTVAPLRYALGGYRPSKTDRLPGSPRPSEGARGLDCPALKGGVSSPAPPAPKGALHSLPLTLSINAGQPVTAYSKGA
jgi:hypothetical protein